MPPKSAAQVLHTAYNRYVRAGGKWEEVQIAEGFEVIVVDVTLPDLQQYYLHLLGFCDRLQSLLS